MRKEIFIKYHEGIGEKHFGCEKTFVKLEEQFYWPRMKEEAKLACANFVRCGARKITTHALKKTLPLITANFPFKRIAINIVEQLSKFQRNNRYLIVVIDYYTCWPEAFALEHQDAYSVALRLISKIISRYGASYVIHTFQERNFKSKIIAELCKLYDIKKNAHDAVPPTA